MTMALAAVAARGLSRFLPRDSIIIQSKAMHLILEVVNVDRFFAVIGHTASIGLPFRVKYS